MGRLKNGQKEGGSRSGDNCGVKKSGESTVTKIAKLRTKAITTVTNKHLKIVKEAWEDVFNSQYTSYLVFKKIQPGSSEEVLLKAKCDLFSVSKNVLVKRLNNKFDTCENMKPIKHLFIVVSMSRSWSTRT